MAKMAGIEIKSFKYYSGHDGEECAQGNIYYNGQKQGFWSQDAWNGPDHFDFNENELENVAKAYYEKNVPVDGYNLMGLKPEDVDFNNLPRRVPDFEVLSLLLFELTHLLEVERFWKRQAKKRSTCCVAVLDFYHGRWTIPTEAGTMIVCNTREEAKEYFKDFTDKYPYAYISFYEKPEDFVK